MSCTLRVQKFNAFNWSNSWNWYGWKCELLKTEQPQLHYFQRLCTGTSRVQEHVAKELPSSSCETTGPVAVSCIHFNQDLRWLLLIWHLETLCSWLLSAYAVSFLRDRQTIPQSQRCSEHQVSSFCKTLFCKKTTEDDLATYNCRCYTR